ncbi:MAG: type II CRISPR RNA-guided endonuclease Cas9 [Ruminococcus sp.]|nr:type II CRISPR RNA-guided endonuclease Cas9 [Ruminococcus sp.]
MINEDYYAGFDIGTDSIGMALTDTKYRVLKYKGRAMWFVRLFDESMTAAERRAFRSGTRRTARKRERISFLQMLFNSAIAEKDVAFYQRLKESNLYEEDKTVGTPYAVFADKDYTDKDYHNDFPTIYHLRKELIVNPEPHDVRLVYLALHHLIKHRGHFLFDSLNASDSHSFDVIFKELQAFLDEEYSIQINCNKPDVLADVLKDRKRKINTKYADSIELCDINKKTDKRAAAVIALICGKSESASVLFDEEITDENGKLLKIELKGDYETRSADYVKVLGDKFELIEKLKAVYDWAVLADILGNEKYISVAKVKSYDKHGKDLKTLKSYVKKYCPEKYTEIFKISKDNLDNYTAYSGMIKKNGKTGVLKNTCNQEEFCKYLLKSFKNLPQNGYEEMLSELESASFMPKQHIKDNGVIPMQINRAELEKILENASGYLPFLNVADESGKTVADKIKDIFNFRIPYYVGPLNKHSDKAWLERKEGKIYPWNFSELVDIDRSAENFINNLTSKCTYLPDKDVIPKNSILYCKFTVLNELNNLRINGEKISVELKKEIFNDLFLQRKKVTQKGLTNYLKSHRYSDIEITGVDGDFKSSMKPYIDLCEYRLSEDEMERIILAVTIFGDDKRLLKKRLKQELSNKLTDKEINKISHLQYSGWGRLSHEFLCDIEAVNPETGEVLNIINALWETNDNLMVLLGSKYQFYKKWQEMLSTDTEKTLKETVASLYVSPAVKRPILQSIKMLNEVVKALGKPPKKIFVEMTRGEQEKKRTISRKDQLLESYKTIKKDAGELYDTLNGLDNDRLRQDKLYLYFTQFGKCMYTGEPIAFDSLFDNNLYDIDHIYPRSKVKDDSLTNRVLVKKKDNAEKDNTYPLSQDIRGKMRPHWKFLLDKGLINKEKFKRLTRVEPLTEDELSDFISRQIVETSQSTKAVAQILDQMYPDSDVVYVKARNVSEFRHNYDMLKCREVNDLHHAKDAYLNIVVGNVYDVLYTRNKANFIAGLQTKKYSLNQMFSFNIKGAWTADKSESLNVVKKMMNKNNIIYTRYSLCKNGTLFDRQPLKKGKGQVPLTKHGARSEIEKYGGYSKAIATYFSLISFDEKKKSGLNAIIPINSFERNDYEMNPKEFIQKKFGYENVVVQIPCIKMDSCVSVDGFRMHICGKFNNGKYLLFKPAMQLILDYNSECYIRNISKFLREKKDNSQREIVPNDKISLEENEALYKMLISKMTNTILTVEFGILGKKLLDAYDKFCLLSVEKQVFVLSEILKVLHCHSRWGNFKDIGIKSEGKIYENSILNNWKQYDSVKLINQSVTGLYENEIVIK